MKKRILAALFAATMMMGLVACGGNTDQSASSGADSKESGETVFTTAVSYIPETLYQSYFSDEFTTITRGIWDPLFYSSNGEIEYYLIDDIKMSEDGLTYTFHINDDADWSDGEPITTEDVFFTLDVCKVWEEIYSSSFTTVEGEAIEYEQIDDKTFEAVLPSPAGTYLREFSSYFKLLPKHMFDGKPEEAVDSDKFASKDLITSGPYTVSEINEDSLVLVKRDDFYRGTPNVDKLVYRLLGQGVTTAAAFESGKLSYMRITNAADLEKYSSDDNYRITTLSEARLNYLQFNYQNFNDRLTLDARKAICMALNGEEIIEGAYGSTELAKPATSMICPDFTIYKERAGYEQNLEEAKKLAESSGLTEIELNYVYCNERANMEEVATMVQAQLAQIGVKVNVKGYDYSTFSNIEYSGEKDWDLLTNGLDAMRGDGLPDVGFLTNEWAESGWSDVVIQTSKEINAESDIDKQKELADKLHQAVLDDYVVYPISWPNYVIVSPKNISGLDASLIVPEFADLTSIKVE